MSSSYQKTSKCQKHILSFRQARATIWENEQKIKQNVLNKMYFYRKLSFLHSSSLFAVSSKLLAWFKTTICC